MNTYVLVYDSFVQFEVMLAAYFLKTAGPVHTLGLSREAVVSAEDFSVNPSVDLLSADVGSIDVLVIPGGDTEELKSHAGLLELIRTLSDQGKPVAAICGGVSVLQAAGVLEGRAHVDDGSTADSVVLSGHILTARPNGYVDFALELGRLLNIYKDEADLQETIDFFKHFKPV
ncbi:DJ-1/PfpI family protein [Paenibacillus tengchongensis]|uniref:DJ-1/PfpI family protein n=1 Tax=Paenibacillus tengchongensis TaxID=2608684 RepID=UPI0016528D46|nr:DJ-1/PfpI family protein [Paenibacillus tengchongensis]